MRKRFPVCCLALFTMLVVAGCAGPRSPLTTDSIQFDLEGVRERYFLPSLGVALVTADTIALSGPVGKARIDRETPVMAGSYYQIGSCTKAMTAAVLEKLMEDNALSWETRLLDLFPEFAGKADPAYSKITLADIALHRAGFPAGGDDATAERLRNYRGTPAEYLGEILQQRPRVQRGRYLYSNNGYAALGAVIERSAGLSYPEAMKKFLFEPLAVKAHFGFPTDLGPGQPWGHRDTWGAAAPARALDLSLPNVLWPAGGASLTLGDLARFLQLHVRGLAGQADSGYSADMISRLHNMHLANMMTAGFYTAGWVVRKVNNETIHWHNGSAGNFMVYLAINRTRKRGIVVVTNVGNNLGSRVGWDIIETMLTDAPRT